MIDRDPLVLDVFHVDHLHRDLRDFYLVHSDEMKNHRAPVNLRDVDLNSVLMVVMKVCLNQDVLGDRMNQLNLVVMILVVMILVVMILVVMILDAMKDDHLMDDQKMNHQMLDDHLMDDRNYLVVLNFRDVLPCAYSLISIEI